MVCVRAAWIPHEDLFRNSGRHWDGLGVGTNRRNVLAMNNAASQRG